MGNEAEVKKGQRKLVLLMIDDQPITPMPTKCIKWGCEDAPPLRRERGFMREPGFMICPKCGDSYGKG